MTEQYFASGEARQIPSLPDGKRTHAFLTCWPRKEAYLEAMGIGLSIPLDSFEVSALPWTAPRLLTVTGDAQAASRWCLRDPAADNAYAVALAVAAADTRMTMFSFP